MNDGNVKGEKANNFPKHKRMNEIVFTCFVGMNRGCVCV